MNAVFAAVTPNTEFNAVKLALSLINRVFPSVFFSNSHLVQLFQMIQDLYLLPSISSIFLHLSLSSLLY